jgi:hypothetical protein
MRLSGKTSASSSQAIRAAAPGMLNCRSPLPNIILLLGVVVAVAPSPSFAPSVYSAYEREYIILTLLIAILTTPCYLHYNVGPLTTQVKRACPPPFSLLRK